MNQLLSQHWSSTTRKMARIHPLSSSSFVHVILWSIANLQGKHVKEVFQGIARMLQISSVLLDWMSMLLFDMLEDSKNVPVLDKRRWTPHSGHSKPGCESTSIWYSMFDPVLDRGMRTFVSEGVTTTTTTRLQNGTKSAHHCLVNDPQQMCVILNPKSLENMTKSSH